MAMTNEFGFDESAHAAHQVAGYAHAWEELAPGIRVRRRVVKPFRPESETGWVAWLASFSPCMALAEGVDILTNGAERQSSNSGNR